MPNSDVSRGSSKWRGRRGKGGGGAAKPERNGFNNARILPLKPSDAKKRMLEQKADDIVTQFLRSGELSKAITDLSREQRKVLHELARIHRITTKSHGVEPNRVLVISLRDQKFTKPSLLTTDPIIPMPDVVEKVTAFVAENPITKMEREHFMAERENKLYQSKSGSLRCKSAVPPAPACPEKLKAARNKLPAMKHKENVLRSIEKSDVVIISGGTGCGKTTQVPQFILEEAHEKKKKVRIMVTQPRRIAAISISERVAKERGETLGDVVGFQVKLESKQSDKTLLTYCTTGVLLRMLTADPIASGITHIIMDEIHEREINTDYLLIALRECMHRRPDLKVILMSATIQGNMNLFVEYFGKLDVSVIQIESLTFDVKTFYLDQILAMSGYDPPENKGFFAPFSFEAEDWQDELDEIREEQGMLEEQRNHVAEPPKPAMPPISLSASSVAVYLDSVVGNTPTSMAGYAPNQNYYSPDGQIYRNNTVTNADGEYVAGDYVTNDGYVIPENQMKQYADAIGGLMTFPTVIQFPPGHPNVLFVNGVTYTRDPNQSPLALMRHGIDRGSLPDNLVEVHCNLPVKPQMIQVPDPLPQELLTPLTPLTPITPASTKSGLGRLGPSNGGFGFGEKHNFSLLLEKKFREEMKTAIKDRPIYYHPQVDELVDQTDFAKLRFDEKYEMFYGVDYKNSIDHHLVDHVVKYLADSPVFGSILVFLPGYDDIQELMNRINTWKDELLNMRDIIVIPLHSQMNNYDHGDIFRPVPKGTRKIILSTNIAEASITIEDVIFVVDTGKAKEKAYSHEAKLSTLTVTPIAKSNAQQRAGRAGRVANGYCVRLYSEKEYGEMPETQIAEMKRSAIYDVTLHAKLFAPNQMRIADFLSLAPEPPSIESIKQSMEFLEQIGAFYSPSKFIMTEEEMADAAEDEIQMDDYDGGKDPDLTDMGRLMSRLPLEPQLSKMLLFGLALKCLTPIVNLVAMLANRDPFILPSADCREQQTKMKNTMALNDFSDHLMLIRLCSQFVSKGSATHQKFCQERFLSYATMRMASGTRRQIVQELIRAKLIYLPPDRELMSILNDRFYNKHSNSWPMVQAAIAAGCYPAIGVSKVESRLKKVQTFNDKPAGLHPSSIVKKQALKLGKTSIGTDPRIEYVAFQELSQMPSDKSLAIKMVTAIPTITALLFTGPIRLSEQVVEDYGIVCEGEDTPLDEPRSEFGDCFSLFALDEWYGVRADKQTLRQFLRLRHKLMHFFLKGIHDPSLFGQDTPRLEMRLLATVRELLETEHKRNKYAEVTMPNFYLRDFEKYQNPHNKPRKVQSKMSNRQMNELQKANNLKINQVGEELRASNGSLPSTSQQPNGGHQQNPPVPKRQDVVGSPHRFATPVPTFDACQPPPAMLSHSVYGNGFPNGSSVNWTPPAAFPMPPPNIVQGAWPAHMQFSQPAYNGNGMQSPRYPGPSGRPMGGYSGRGGRGGSAPKNGSYGGYQPNGRNSSNV